MTVIFYRTKRICAHNSENARYEAKLGANTANVGGATLGCIMSSTRQDMQYLRLPAAFLFVWLPEKKTIKNRCRLIQLWCTFSFVAMPHVGAGYWLGNADTFGPLTQRRHVFLNMFGMPFSKKKSCMFLTASQRWRFECCERKNTQRVPQARHRRRYTWKMVCMRTFRSVRLGPVGDAQMEGDGDFKARNTTAAALIENTRSECSVSAAGSHDMIWILTTLYHI